MRNKEKGTDHRNRPSYNTAYTLRAGAIDVRDIASFCRNVVYAGAAILSKN